MIRRGDTVCVHPHGHPEQVAVGKVEIISANQKSIAVVFPDKPPFVNIFRHGLCLHPDGIAMLASREDVSTWVELTSGGHYEIVVAQ